MLKRTWLTASLLLHPLVLPGAFAEEAARPSYATVRASPDGIGKVYLGREIAQVMTFHGARWLERPERMEEERQGEQLGAFAWLIKPISKKALDEAFTQIRTSVD